MIATRKVYAAVLLTALALGFGLGWRLKPAAPAPETRAESQTATTVTTTTKTIEHKPDGTVIEHKRQKKTTVAHEDRKTVTIPLPATAGDHWSLGLGLRATTDDPFRAPSWSLELGHRLGESPWWLDGGIEVRERRLEALTLGVRITW